MPPELDASQSKEKVSMLVYALMIAVIMHIAVIIYLSLMLCSKYYLEGDNSVFKRYLNPAFLLASSILIGSTSLIHAAPPTTVYKVIAEDGSISFSDKVQSGSEAVQIKPVTTIPAIDVTQNKALSPTSKNTSSTNYYQDLSIISPANNTAFNSGGGIVQVVVQAQPPLRKGDLFELQLDGTVVGNQPDTSFSLSGVNRGTHILTLKIKDRQQKTLKTAVSTITVHRPIARPASIN